MLLTFSERSFHPENLYSNVGRNDGLPAEGQGAITGPCSDPGPRTHGHGGHSAATKRHRGGHQKQISPFKNIKSQKGSFPHKLLRWYCDATDNKTHQHRSVRMEPMQTSPMSHWFQGCVAMLLTFVESLLVLSAITFTFDARWWIFLAVIFNAIALTVVYTGNNPHECIEYFSVLSLHFENCDTSTKPRVAPDHLL